ncbi:uncharacterized protein LOC129766221 [Toxorhynchites rutilus septentrionalis]|uniref:uncharacterized protein LOC129766221 n=1 Tax=Toxorhynchites rutilus septentrionalis TaxID=329112 RepID=UPI00247861A1|nr:uncharacterized protein LOC129766221 [Toxorhynchites rutilus septentrionalis]
MVVYSDWWRVVIGYGVVGNGICEMTVGNGGRPTHMTRSRFIMSSDRRIKSLKTRQKSLLSSFNLIVTFVDTYHEETGACEVPVRLEHLVTIWNDFNTVQSDLETLDEAGFLLSLNKAPSTPVNPPSPTNQSNQQFPTTASHIRLPDIKLPVFSGNIDQWLNFHDLFVSLVHSSHELSSVQKFYYLRSSLAGEALKLVQTIAISANNYFVAWNLLLEYYQNTVRLKQSYIDSLFEFPTLKRESVSELHSLVERFEANVKILKQLGEKTEYWDIILIRILSIRLDPTTRRDWEECASTNDAMKFSDLTSFIQRRVSVLQSIGRTSDVSQPQPTKRPLPRPVSSHGANSMSPRKCIMCPNHHPLYLCAVFSKLSIGDKDKEVRRHQLCRNCLHKGHRADNCPSSSTCRKCHGHHHTQLCSDSSSTFPSAKVPESFQSKEDRTQTTDDKSSVSMSAALGETVANASSGRGVKSVVLATAIVLVVDDSGIEHHVRALLDSGSECCFATESFVRRLVVQRQKINLPITGIGQRSTHARFKIVSTVRSLVTEYSASVDFVILPRVTVDLPATSFNISSWKIPPGIQLADPSFHQSAPIDIILGAELFFDLFKAAGRIQLDSNGPLFVNSVFGWIVSGRNSTGQSTAPASVNIATIVDLQQQMEKFWTSANYSAEEAACEEHFQRNVSRNSEGRYIVRLPVRNDTLFNLEDNRRAAIRRFRFLEHRLLRNGNLRKQYCDFLEEYRALGHMYRVYDHENATSPSYHLPHHCVVREDRSTTKVRVVFDASCKTPSGPSLNDALMVGPVIQKDIRSIIIRSRIRPIMMIADIKQMYRQILVDKEDTPLQRIVWRFSPDDPLETYELRTVTYRTASAPFLATRVLQQLPEDERHEHSQAATVLKRDFYVDDLFSGANSVQEAIVLRQQLEFLLNKGGFQLRKWASNEPAVLEAISLNNRALQASVDFDRDSCIKTLGLHWEPSTDNLRYKIDLPIIARLFDPLGLVGPIVTTAKLFIQALWTLKDSDDKVLGWDQELPPPMIEHWTSYLSQLPRLNELRIPRYVLCRNPTTVQLHIFSDASERAYGSYAYLHSTNSDKTITVALLTAKSKVAPIKKQSIPRLELCGALLASQLYGKITASLQLSAETFFWVDSTVVLSWLDSTPSTWTTFVANRVSKIQLATDGCRWNHVAGQLNPADCISRGTTAELLPQNELWWSGPFWLKQHLSCWPIQHRDELKIIEAQRETRKTPVVSAPTMIEPTFLDQFVEKFSCYDRMMRVLAYCQRFHYNCLSRKFTRRNSSSPSTDEVSRAEKTLISLVQQQCFNSDWNQLQQRKPVSAKSPLRWFHPFLAPDGLMHFGGRLERSQQPFEVKHPILLPSSHRFSLLLVRHYHQIHLHAAPQLLLTIIRLRFWITGARKLAKRVVHNCTICCRARPKQVEQFMSDLPASRVTASRPFSVTGVDYWGPILLKQASRKAAPRKAYVAVFICFSTKAVHLELVSDLSTAKFIQALRRFISQRGFCAEIHSDNGRNFVGAANELRRLFRSEHHQQAVQQESVKNGIRWFFNPPKASNFGGLWEAAIASAQKHFYRVLGPNKLADDDMQTLLKQIECCLNSRPLVPLSDDHTDFEPLTPGHFLIGSAMKAIPDMDLTKIPSNRLRHWEHTQKIFQHLWQRWHTEYLSTLQPRSKWCNPPVVIEKGKLVVIKDENTPPVQWPTGRIIELHPGAGSLEWSLFKHPAENSFSPYRRYVCFLLQQHNRQHHQKNQRRKRNRIQMRFLKGPVCLMNKCRAIYEK